MLRNVCVSTLTIQTEKNNQVWWRCPHWKGLHRWNSPILTIIWHHSPHINSCVGSFQYSSLALCADLHPQMSFESQKAARILNLNCFSLLLLTQRITTGQRTEHSLPVSPSIFWQQQSILCGVILSSKNSAFNQCLKFIIQVKVRKRNNLNWYLFQSCAVSKTSLHYRAGAP